ncbi:MAG TPA: hypothetical protein PLR25_13875 [Planctomycetaceae bacterium]|nr:hypothetical protein [Planctomycetaceae bacterium]
MAKAGNTGKALEASERQIGSNLTSGSPFSTLAMHCALLILILLTLSIAAGGRYMLQRQMWMDEIHSWLLITEPDTQRSLQALADGVDFNPPTYILLARQLQHLPGSVTESGLRWFSLFLMLLAVVGVFVLLHRRFPLPTCIAAILMMASSTQLIHQSAEVRFYPLWCAACAWLCVTLDVQPNQSAWWQRINNSAAVLLAGVITTTHYFGILSLGLICLGASLMPNLSRGRRWMIVLVALTGGLCLVGCLPFLIGQRAALSRSTWVSPATVSDSIGFLTAMYPLLPLLVAIVAFLISLALANSGDRKPPSVNFGMFELRSLAPSLMLSLMPIVIVLVSWTIQPALVTRYAVTGVIGFGSVFAVLMAHCGIRLQMVLVAVGGVFLFGSVNFCSNQWFEIDQQRDVLVKQLRDLPSDGPIVFEDRTVSMPVLHSHPELRARCALVDFSDNQLLGDSRLHAVQRDVGRRIQKWYPKYAMRSLDSLDSESTFYVVPYAESQTASLKWPADFTVTHISPTLDRHDHPASPAN